MEYWSVTCYRFRGREAYKKQTTEYHPVAIFLVECFVCCLAKLLKFLYPCCHIFQFFATFILQNLFLYSLFTSVRATIVKIQTWPKKITQVQNLSQILKLCIVVRSVVELLPHMRV